MNSLCNVTSWIRAPKSLEILMFLSKKLPNNAVVPKNKYCTHFVNSCHNEVDQDFWCHNIVWHLLGDKQTLNSHETRLPVTVNLIGCYCLHVWMYLGVVYDKNLPNHSFKYVLVRSFFQHWLISCHSRNVLWVLLLWRDFVFSLVGCICASFFLGWIKMVFVDLLMN